jgi:hypothetical protein
MGALNVIAATMPSALDITVSAFASQSILTNAPFPLPLEPVLLDGSVSLAKLLHLGLLRQSGQFAFGASEHVSLRVLPNPPHHPPTVV